MGRQSGLYIHIPFCERKCDYCGFLSFDDRNAEEINRYTEALKGEIRILSETPEYKDISFDTVFIGGGTPSILPSGTISSIMEQLFLYLNISERSEITIESNPNSLTVEKLLSYLDSGINRLSIGVQSFDDDVLSSLGRIHDSGRALEAYTAAVKAGFNNINLDLMFGVPGQNDEQWKASVETAAALLPSHLSLYSLQLEEGTRYYSKYKNGEIDLPKVSLDRKMYHDSVAFLADHGYEHYEISNFAKTGKRCEHNMKYWKYACYLGIGAGASSFINGKRPKNINNINNYVDLIENERLPREYPETIYSEDEEMGIYCFTALRTSEGIDLDDFEMTFGRTLGSAYPGIIEALNGYIDNGLILSRGSSLALTEKGVDISNDIMAEFV